MFEDTLVQQMLEQWDLPLSLPVVEPVLIIILEVHFKDSILKGF